MRERHHKDGVAPNAIGRRPDEHAVVCPRVVFTYFHQPKASLLGTPYPQPGDASSAGTASGHGVAPRQILA